VTKIAHVPAASEVGTAGLRRLLLVRLSDESGIALVMVLGIMLVLTLVLATVMFLTSSRGRDAQWTNAGERAYAVAEAGVNNAVSVLNAQYSSTPMIYPGDGCILHAQSGAGFYAIGFDAGSSCGGATEFTNAFDSGSCSAPKMNCATWSGAIQPVTGAAWHDQWVIRSTGSVLNPTGPSTAPVVRTVTAVVPVVIPPGEQVNASSTLNWIMEPAISRS
jgi:Tfp pilus assembly protein PilX